MTYRKITKHETVMHYVLTYEEAKKLATDGWIDYKDFIQHPWMICRTGDGHAQGTRDESKVTCARCLDKLHPNKWLETYQAIIDAATKQAIEQAKLDGRAGIVGPLTLVFKRGEVKLLNLHAVDIPDGFLNSFRELQPSVPYEAYGRWIRENTKDLEVLP